MMKALDKILPEEADKKKTFYKLLGVLIVGVMLLIVSSTFKSTSKKLTSSPQESQPVTSKTDQNLERQEEPLYEMKMEARLKNILKKMQGVGEVEVMITTTYGKEIILAEDMTSHQSATLEEDQEGGNREVSSYDDQKKIVMQNANLASGSEPIIIKEKQPEIQGVLVIAEGAASSVVKESITEAAQILLGIPAHTL